MKEKKLLVIAGQPKAGTTSLFNWLSGHPDICPSKVKETRFFLDSGHPAPRSLSLHGDGLEAYFKFFECTGRPVLMEASPDYFGCSTPLKLPEMLPNVYAVIIMRDHLNRLQSAFSYYRERGFLPAQQSFDDWIKRQELLEVTPDTEIGLRALDLCRPTHLKKWQASFGNRLLVIDFQDLKNDPQGVLLRVARHVGIDSGNLAALDTKAYNISKKIRSPRIARVYYPAVTKISHALGERSLLRSVLRPFGRLARHMLEKKVSVSKPNVSPASREVIERISKQEG